MRSSRAAVDLIIEFEIGSRDQYDAKYKRPEWPGVSSGITVGIGYDLGYNDATTILNDWSNLLEPNVIKAMQRYSGLTGSAASHKLSEARQSILVPWDAGMAVFMKTSLPKFEAITLRACPGSDKLPAGCFGVLTSLSYNRGASYSKEGDRYAEMRQIRKWVATGEWDKVSSAIRNMKRIWANNPNARGLLRRRDAEAKLWDESLHAAGGVRDR